MRFEMFIHEQKKEIAMLITNDKFEVIDVEMPAAVAQQMYDQLGKALEKLNPKN